MKEKLNGYLYYILIGGISIILMLVMPMLGSELALELVLPTTVGGWIVWGITMGLSALGNMALFFGFMEQAKLNVRNNERYKKANDILINLAIKNPKDKRLPQSPKKWTATQYSKKGTFIFLGSAASSFGLANAILQFNPVILISYVITVSFAIIFGIFQMKKAENYWTDEYYQYAMYEKNKYEDHKEDLINDHSGQQDLQKS